MMSFSLSGGVEVYGFIAPTEITDEYPVIDPLYGIDGFRNVDTLNDLNNIPTLRRRAGMVVGIGGGSQYYKLNSGPWNGTITDWTIFNSGGGGVFTGGTVTGPTIFTNGLTANTLTVNGVQITGDTYTTGGTYSNGTITFDYNTGGGYQVVGLYTGETSYVNSLTTGTGLSADTTTGNITIINTDPDQVVSISGGTGILTGGTYPNFTIENTLPDQVVTLSGGTGILTGGTYPNFTIENTLPDQVVSISGGTNVDVTGTYPNFNIALTGLSDNNIYTTGFTYSANTFYITDTSGNTFPATINVMTGLTINGNLTVTGTTSLQGLSATTISATTIGSSGDCVDNIYVSNIHSCSPLNINPLDEGNVYFGSTSGVTIDLTNNRVGIGTTTPSAKLDVSGTTRISGSITSNTITEYFNNWQGTQNISSGFTPFSVTTHTLFAPTISSQATSARPYGLSIVPGFNGTIDSKHAVYISNTNTSPTSPGLNTSLVITSLGANELGQYIRVSGSSTIGSYIDQAQTGQVITRLPSGGTGLSINRTNGSEVAYTPINTFQQLSGTPSQSIFEYRNISSGNSTEINGLDLLNSSTGKFGDTLGNNAGINLRLGITNSSGLNNRYAKIAAIAPNQATLSNVIDLGLYVSNTGGTTTNAIYIKGSDQNVGIGITSPTAKLHINNTTSGNTFLAEDDTNPDSSPFVIDASGNTGIGTTTPLAKLDVSSNGGRLRLTQNTAGNVFNGIDFVSYVGGITGSLISNQFTGELRLFTPSTYFPTFYSSGNEVMRISTSGNVGIGTTTPSQKLQVSGNISVSGSVIPNTQIISSSATVTPTYGNDLVAITGLSTNVTINNPTGTWPEGKDLTIRIKDNGVARTITWDTKYRAIGVTLPNTTVASKTTYVGLIYNSIDDKFDVIGSTTEL